MGNQDSMEDVLRELAPVLKGAGFRKQRHTFSRRMTEGILHAIRFQLGQPGGSAEGRFAVNLGVFVPEMAFEGIHVLERRIAPEHCHLKLRLEHVVPHETELWWPLHDPEVTARLRAELETHGLGWLDRFRTHADLIEEYSRAGWRPLGMGPVGQVRMAWLLSTSDRDASEELIRSFMAERHDPAHLDWLRTLLAMRSLDHLIVP